MPRFLSIVIIASFFFSPILSFAGEMSSTEIEISIYLFFDQQNGLLSILPISENTFIFAYATSSEFAEIGLINLEKVPIGEEVSREGKNSPFTPLGILLVPLNPNYESASQNLESGAGIGQRIYTGHEYDATTEYTFAGARYLDTSVSKFLSQDPEARDNPEQFLKDPQQLNTYSYARNNPLILVDRSGEKVELAARPAVTQYGLHFFYIVTPDNPGQININGLPEGTEQFTLGGYNHRFPLLLKNRFYSYYFTPPLSFSHLVPLMIRRV